MISKKAKDDDGTDLNLDIPDLPDDVNLITWQIPNTSTYEWINYNNQSLTIDQNQSVNKTTKANLIFDDEGFYSNKCSPNLSTSEYLKINDPWEKALKFSISEYIDWDMKNEY